MHFDIVLEENEYLYEFPSLAEMPPSIEQFDSIVKQKVRFVKEHCMYRKSLKVLSEESFNILGRVAFLVEPICLPYYLEFTLSQQSGLLHIQYQAPRVARELMRK